MRQTLLPAFSRGKQKISLPGAKMRTVKNHQSIMAVKLYISSNAAGSSLLTFPLQTQSSLIKMPANLLTSKIFS